MTGSGAPIGILADLLAATVNPNVGAAILSPVASEIEAQTIRWINYHEYGLQNSRGFRALKVWLGLRHVGRDGYVQMIGDDIALARALYDAVGTRPELEAATHHLSITTFRFVPLGLPNDPTTVEPYLNDLNEELLNRLQRSGEAFVSNAVVDGKYFLRACIVNFRTTLPDVDALPEIVIRLGRNLDSEIRPGSLRSA